MADIAALADSLKSSGGIVTTAADEAKANASTFTGSVLKVPGIDKDTKKDANNADSSEVKVSREQILTEAYANHPTVPDKAVTSADFYRRGKIRNPTDPSLAQNLFNSNVFAVNRTGADYEIFPRRIDENPEESPASIRLIGKPTTGATTKEVDLIPPYSKLLLENVQEGHQERSQIIETFGNFYVFFFGERPPVYTFSGTLINAHSINWVEDFMFYYDNFLRGTKCVELNAKLVITYGHRQVEGFILGVNMNTQAINDKGVSVSFQVLVIDRKVLKLSIDFGLVEANGRFNDQTPFILNLIKGLSNPNVSEAVTEVNSALNLKKPLANTNAVTAVSKEKLEQQFNVPLSTTNKGTLVLA